jgi:hypothetical protein
MPQAALGTITFNGVIMRAYKLFLLTLMLGLFLPLTAGAHTPAGTFTQHYPGTLFVISENNVFSAELIIRDNNLFTGFNTPWFIIHDEKDRDVLGASLTVEAFLQDQPENSSVSFSARDVGHGLYVVPDLYIPEPGSWNLRVTVEKGFQKDEIAFSFPYVRQAEPASDRFATRQEGILGKMAVEYQPSRQITSGSRHNWQLQITAPDGNPVTNADVELTGVHLETGQELSERAKVSGRPGRGSYRAENMLFAQPGPWSVVFIIFTPSDYEVVEFQLVVE